MSILVSVLWTTDGFLATTTAMTIIIATIVEKIQFSGYEVVTRFASNLVTTGYDALLSRFQNELQQLWRIEDEEND
jgi:hypothetical protein